VLKYSISLDMANNGINMKYTLLPKGFGDI
jgi:hypothetical protein